MANFFNADIWFAAGVILALICLSGFFSGSETALTSTSARLRELARKGDWRAQIVEQLRHSKDLLLGTVLIGNNLVNIFAASFTTGVALRLFGDSGLWWTTLSLTLAIVLFAEVLPKSWALRHADTIALWVAPIIQPLVFVLQPVTRPLRAIVRVMLRPFDSVAEGSDFSSARARLETMRGAIDLHSGEKREERGMLHAILDLDEVAVEDVITHRKDVEMLDLNWSTEKIATRVLQSAWTRFLVYDANVDDIVGVLHAKAFFRYWKTQQRAQPVSEGTRKEQLRACLSPPWFVPDNTRLLYQLRAFQTRKEHFAIVLDEYGAFMGIVTLEDIIEQIVGNIDDEHDITPGQEIRLQLDGSYIVAGDVPIRVLRRELNWALPEDKAVTIAGLVIQESRVLPEPGQVFVFHGFRFHILRKEENRIVELSVQKITSTPTKEGEKQLLR